MVFGPLIQKKKNCERWRYHPRQNAHRGLTAEDFMTYLEDNPAAFSFAKGPRVPPQIRLCNFFGPRQAAVDPGTDPPPWRRAGGFRIQEIHEDLMDDVNLLLYYQEKRCICIASWQGIGASIAVGPD